MTVGDIITGTTGAFQPAAGVEIIILTIFNKNNTLDVGVQNGVSNMFNAKGNYNYPFNQDKIGITNSWNYYNSGGFGFTGIQIK